MKKVMSILLVLVALFASTTAALAAEYELAPEDWDSWDEVVEWANQYAYLDLETAEPELQEIILQARNVIINSTSWVADGYEGGIENILTGEFTPLPHFSEVFPEDWEPPVYPTEVPEDAQMVEIPEARSKEPTILPLAAVGASIVGMQRLIPAADSPVQFKEPTEPQLTLLAYYSI